MRFYVVFCRETNCCDAMNRDHKRCVLCVPTSVSKTLLYIQTKNLLKMPNDFFSEGLSPVLFMRRSAEKDVSRRARRRFNIWAPKILYIYTNTFGEDYVEKKKNIQLSCLLIQPSIRQKIFFYFFLKKYNIRLERVLH